jgi:dipeptide/tripeptide permease
VLLPVRTLFAHQWLTIPDYVIRCFPKAIGARYEWFQGINPVVIVIGVPLIAAATRKVNIITMMILGTSVSALTTFLLVPGPGVGRLIAYIVLFSVGEAMWASRFLEYVADLAPAGQVGAYMGLAGIPWFLAKATTGLYSGHMIARYLPEHGHQDSGTLWLIYGLIALITPVGLLIGRKWVQRGVVEAR